MKPSPRENAEVMLGETERKNVTVDFHHQFKDFISRPSREFDEVDELVEEIRAAEFERKGARP
jgi:hypothetical protein